MTKKGKPLMTSRLTKIATPLVIIAMIAGINLSATSANAAPSTPTLGTPSWYSVGSEQTSEWFNDTAPAPATGFEIPNTSASEITSTAFSDPNNVEGIANTPPADVDASGNANTDFVANLAVNLNRADYTADNGSYSVDFMDNAFAADWDLNGNWYVLPGSKNDDLTTEATPAFYGSGDIVTPTNFMALSTGNEAFLAGGSVYFERTDGSYIFANLNLTRQVFITGAPATALTATAGTPLTISVASLAAGATYDSGSTRTPDEVVWSDLPTGATADAAGNLTFTGTSNGTVTLNYVLEDTASFAVSQPLTVDVAVSGAVVTVTPPPVHLPTVTG
jgi:hypothetical protein